MERDPLKFINEILEFLEVKSFDNKMVKQLHDNVNKGQILEASQEIKNEIYAIHKNIIEAYPFRD